MSPDKKLDWFRARGYTSKEVAHIRDLVKARFVKSYASGAGTAQSGASVSALRSSSFPDKSVRDVRFVNAPFLTCFLERVALG
jgi:hypothetical protein